MAFYNCNSLKNVYIPPTVETIDEYAFGYTEGQFATDRLPVEGFAISGKKGSAAEKYAADNNIVFIDVDTILKKNYGEEFGLRLDNLPDGNGAVVTAVLPLRRREEKTV